MFRRFIKFAVSLGLVLCAYGLNSTSYSLAFDPGAVERLKSKPVCSGCDLSGVTLKDAYLPGAVLTNSNLTHAA